MFDWLRKATQSAEISRQERVLDYVDETLSAEARKRFEAELSDDADLQREVAELRTVKAALNALPRQPVPRNFTLDPAKYSKPARAWDAQLYPAMRMATALTAIMFMIVATLTFLPFGAGGDFAAAPSAMQSAESVTDSASEVAMMEEMSPEMAESLDMAVPAVEQGESDSAEFDSAANSARVGDETMDESVADSAEMVEMDDGEVVMESLPAATAMPTPTLAPEVASEAMSDDDVAADEMVEESASDAAASSGPAPVIDESTATAVALQPQSTGTAAPTPTPLATRTMSDEPASDASSAAASSGAAPEVANEFESTPTAMPAPTSAPELATEVFKSAPPLEEGVPEETVAEAISAEPTFETIGAATDASDTVDAPLDNAAATGGAAAENQSSQIRPIMLWAIALLGLFLLLLFLTLRTRSRL